LKNETLFGCKINYMLVGYQQKGLEG